MAGKTPNPAPKPRDQVIEAAVLALVRGEDADRIIARIVKLGVTLDDAGLVLVDARRKIQLTAEFHRDEELGKSIRRLNRLIELNLGEEDTASALLGDHGVALRAQIELNKLLRLHEVNAGAGGGGSGEPDEATDRADELGRARGHLAPLFADVPDDYPLSELARMAAEKLRTGDGGGNPET